MPSKPRSFTSEAALFIKRVLNNPRQLGAVLPSSSHLGAEMAKHITIDKDTPIVELGGGTGSLTQAIVDTGIAPERVYTVELDPALCDYLRSRFPKCNVINGCAGDLAAILPKKIQGKVGVTVSGLPLLNFPREAMDDIIKSAFSVMNDQGYMLQFTYSPKSSLPAEDYGLVKEHMGTVLRNVPPATVWKYSRGA